MSRRGIPGSVLKAIALVSMLIDHFAVVFYIGSHRAGAPLFSYGVYLALRSVGRLAFPLYCFLLTEGYRHTRDVKRYLARLAVFGLVSEVPFDLAFCGDWVSWNYQNVYFTLALGLIAVWIWDSLMRERRSACRIVLGLLAVAVAAAAAEFGRTDYGALGVLTIAAMHLFRDSEWQRDLFSGCALVLSSPLEAFAWLSFVPLHFYNGERGRQLKYLYYLFYPWHLAVLVLLRRTVYG